MVFVVAGNPGFTHPHYSFVFVLVDQTGPFFPLTEFFLFCFLPLPGSVLLRSAITWSVSSFYSVYSFFKCFYCIGLYSIFFFLSMSTFCFHLFTEFHLFLFIYVFFAFFIFFPSHTQTLVNIPRNIISSLS